MLQKITLCCCIRLSIFFPRRLLLQAIKKKMQKRKQQKILSVRMVNIKTVHVSCHNLSVFQRCTRLSIEMVLLMKLKSRQLEIEFFYCYCYYYSAMKLKQARSFYSLNYTNKASFYIIFLRKMFIYPLDELS